MKTAFTLNQEPRRSWHFCRWIVKSTILLALTTFAVAQGPDERIVILPVQPPQKAVPLFFSASAEVKAQASLETITSDQQIHFTIHQGTPETLTLGLNGQGSVLSVTGADLRDWAVRVNEKGERFLDIRPLITQGKNLIDLQISVKTLLEGTQSVLLPHPGAATGFSLSIALGHDTGTDLRVIQAEGLVPVDSKTGRQFYGTGNATLGLAISPSGAGSRGLELIDTLLSGTLAADGNSISFRLAATARAIGSGATAELFSQGATLSGSASGAGWHVVLKDNRGSYELVAGRGGDFPLELDFVVPVTRKGDWSVLTFGLPAGVVVPVKIDGLGETVTFDRTLAVVPARDVAHGADFSQPMARPPWHGAARGRWRTVPCFSQALNPVMCASAAD